jgi:hypothetical protein
MVVTLQGIKDILHGDAQDFATVNEAVFDFVRKIHLSNRTVHSSKPFIVSGNRSRTFGVGNSPIRWCECETERASKVFGEKFIGLGLENNAVLIESATAQELLDGNDLNFIHRAEHLAATKAAGAPELVRAYANSLEYRVKSEHFEKNYTYYRVWVLLKDFKILARDKKIPIEDAIDYALNYCDVHVSCTCPSFLYYGFRYMGDQLDYLYGLPREKRFPIIRNPSLRSNLCKHAHLVLEQLKKDQEKIIKMFAEYYKKLPSTPQNQMIAIPAPKPAEVTETPAFEENEETGDIEVGVAKKETQVDVEPEVISADDPSDPGTVYVDTKLAEDSLPEDQQYKYAGDGDEDSVPEEGVVDQVPAGEAVSTEDVDELEKDIEEASTSPRNDNERFSTEWSFQSLRRA